MPVCNHGAAVGARKLVAKARDPVARHFAVPMQVGESNRGLWYDWLFARIMVREATMLIGGEF